MEKHFEAFAPDHKVKGTVIVGYKRAINSDRFATYFEKHGFADVDPNQWYPAQSVLDVFNDMEANAHGFLDFVSIGMAMAANLGVPSHIDAHSPEQMLAFLSNAQGATTFTSHPGYVKLERMSDAHYQLDARTIMPDDLFYGVIYAFAREFVPVGSHFRLSYPKDGKRRDFGDDYTTMDLRWD